MHRRRAPQPRICRANSVALAVVGLLSVAAGCSADSDPDDDPAGAADHSAADLSAADLSAADRDAIAKALAERADLLGLVHVPSVPIVRVVSAADSPQTVAQCLNDAGFPTTLTPDGQGYTSEYPGEQADAYTLAEYTCLAQFPTAPQQTGPLSSAQKEIVFAYLSQTLVDCLDDEGITVSDVPTRETFIGSFDVSPPWNPFTQVYRMGLSASELDDLESTCPPNTPPDLVYGGQ